MEELRYYPLISMDTDGREKQPMFPTTDRAAVTRANKLWLTEMIPNYFRLCSAEKLNYKKVAAFRVHCPKCGKPLKALTTIARNASLPLYACNACLGSR